MKRITVGAAALNQTPLDWEGNCRNIINAIRASEETSASHTGVAVLCLPELCITGYGCEDAFLSSNTHEMALKMLDLIASERPKGIVCVGLPIMYQNALYNATAVLQNGRVIGVVAKQHLAGDGIHYEPRWFKPWPAGKQVTITVQSDSRAYTVPFGDLVFDFDGVKIGFEICEDAWVADRPGARLARRGVDIILNPSASHFAFRKQTVRKRFVIEGSRAFACTYVYANLLGNEAGRAIYDGECLIASGGNLVAQGERFSMKPFTLTTAVVDIDATRTQQVATASFTPEIDAGPVVSRVNGLVTGGAHPHPRIAHTTAKVKQPREEDAPMSPFEEFTQAAPLALYDYLRKSRSRGFILSLSGGADSGVCAYLVRLMVLHGTDELGLDQFSRNVGLGAVYGSVNHQGVVDDLSRRLLTCVYQSTRNSSDTTLNAAKLVAKDVSAKFVQLDVDVIAEHYKSLVSVGLQYELDWGKDDIALQNIQARVRAPSVWMIANIENKLLLTTSNRSEAAVGYCTMDGDTAGSIAPIAGVDKAFLIEWLAYLKKRQLKFEEGLSAILDQKPTAELRPGGGQTDEKDLMPYPVLDFIENLAILERKGPADVYTSLRDHLDDFWLTNPPTIAETYEMVAKFFRLWCRNQWKRERYALSFHMDDKNLDPRAWCRFPVLSGGFETELSSLKRALGL